MHIGIRLDSTREKWVCCCDSDLSLASIGNRSCYLSAPVESLIIDFFKRYGWCYGVDVESSGFRRGACTRCVVGYHTPGVISLAEVRGHFKVKSVTYSTDVVKIVALRSDTVTNRRSKDISVKIEIVMMQGGSW